MDKDRLIYSNKLIHRIRTTPLWISFYIMIILFGIFMSYLKMDKMNGVSWLKLSIYLVIIYLIYILWGITYLFFLKKSVKIVFPFIPWFGILPKAMLFFEEYKRFELSYFGFSILSLIIVKLFLVDNLHLFLYSFILSIVIFRLFLVIRIIKIKNKNIWLKYESYGISVYKVN